MKLEGQRVVIVGLGTSGLAAADVALKRGAEVVLSDSRDEKSFAGKLDPYVQRGAELALGGHEGADLARANIVVLSPGVPPFALLDEAAAKGVLVIGEVEFALRLSEDASPAAPLFAIGGTNGKSTVTTLVGEILAEESRTAKKKPVFVGGNLGEPLAAHVEESFDAIVLEVSSFQLERAPTFHPRATALLNVTDDHLDRYVSFDAYADAKGNAFVNQTPYDIAVIPFGDPICARQAARGKGRVVTFGEAGADIVVTKDAIVDRERGESYARANILLQGAHNAANVAAAIGLVRNWVSAETITKVLASFRGLPHRTELVAEIAGVRYYDDSKGTNVGATVTALLGLSEPRAVLIAGGRDKGGSYGPIAEALKNKGRSVVLIGEAADAMQAAFEGIVPIDRAISMREAVEKAKARAIPGDAVLLSPACSSFDMFRDYKHRGEEFVHSVMEHVPNGG